MLTKICAWCHEPFQSKYPCLLARRSYCGKTCANRHNGQKLRGQVPSAASKARHERADARISQVVAGVFGQLTDREKAIWKHGKAHGYSEGYNRAYAPLRTGAA